MAPTHPALQLVPVWFLYTYLCRATMDHPLRFLLQNQREERANIRVIMSQCLWTAPHLSHLPPHVAFCPKSVSYLVLMQRPFPPLLQHVLRQVHRSTWHWWQWKRLDPHPESCALEMTRRHATQLCWWMAPWLDLDRPTKVQYIFSLVGLDRPGAIAEGRRAAQQLKDRYGIEVSGLPDEAYLSGQTDISGYGFAPIVLEGDLKLVFGYSLVRDVLWRVEFSTNYNSTGDYSGTIPAGAFVHAGNFIIDLCDCRSRRRFCSSLTRLGLRRRILRLRYIARSYVDLVENPEVFSPITPLVQNEDLGEGVALGSFYDLNGLGTSLQGQLIIRFPRSSVDPWWQQL